MKVYSDLAIAYFEALAADPSSGVAEGRFYYNTASSVLKWRTSSAWKTAVDTDSTQTLSNKSFSTSVTITGNSNSCLVLNRAGTTVLQIQDTANGRTLYMGADSNDPWIGTSTAHKLRLLTSGVVRGEIGSGGNWVIGNTGTGARRNHTVYVDGDSGSGFVDLKTETALASGQDMALRLYTNTFHASGVGCYRHTSNGNVGYLFLASASGTFVRYYYVDPVNGYFKETDGAVGLGTNSSPGGVVGAQTSDRRLKQNIVDMDDALDLVMRMPKGKRFEYKHSPGRTEIGWLADELQSVVPQAVFSSNMTLHGVKDYLQVYPWVLVPVLAGALKAVKIELDDLKKQLKVG
jgi:hypothetical protein